MELGIIKRNIRYHATRLKEKVILAIAFRLPDIITHWAAVKVMSYATTSDKYAKTSPYDISILDAMQVWMDERLNN